MTLVFALALGLGNVGLAGAQKQLTIGAFTKNFTNPAYENFRIGVDKIAKSANARVIHYVPKKPDDVDEQMRMRYALPLQLWWSPPAQLLKLGPR